eukprot:jgi/Pico_ML_1/55316/g1017.t1
MALVNQIYLDECCPIGKRTHKEVKDLMRKQKELNREALAATGLGGARMHTDLEAGAQHLLDLQEHVDTERATEKEGRLRSWRGWMAMRRMR